MTTASRRNRLALDLRDVGDVVFDAEVLEGYRRDQAAPGLLKAGRPTVLVRPRTTAQVQAAVRVAARHRMPVVARGAGSGLSGGANAVDDCMLLSLEQMTEIVSVEERSLTATVQPGVVNDTLRGAARQRGLWYAPDPASHEFSTIGGNVATNAGGLCCVKYGVTRDSLLELEVVLADGEVVRLGGRTRKCVAGYDLVGLFCGSEGTLGVITEATVRLQPPPGRAATLAAVFSELGAAGEAVAAIVAECRPSLLELMDRATINAVEDFKPMSLERTAEALLFARSDNDGGIAEVERMSALCEEAGASLVASSDEEAEGRMLMAARRLAYPALERRGSTLLDDVAVPLDRVPDLLAGVEGIGVEQEVEIATFGHAGDGDMHPTIVYDQADPAQSGAARSAFTAILELAQRLGGTITGEHGVGLLKQGFLEPQLGRAIDLHRQVKRALDPHGLLNPGKGI